MICSKVRNKASQYKHWYFCTETPEVAKDGCSAVVTLRYLTVFSLCGVFAELMATGVVARTPLFKCSVGRDVDEPASVVHVPFIDDSSASGRADAHSPNPPFTT